VNLDLSSRPPVGVLSLAGACFGVSDGPALRRAFDTLRDRGHRRVVVDLQAATHLDSPALGELIEEAVTLRALGGDLHLAGAERAMRGEPLFGRLLGQVFVLYPSVAAAIEGFDVADARLALASVAVAG
jgi:hypothetical protein